MHNREITHIVKTGSFIKKSNDCKDHMFVMLSFKRNLCQN